MSPACYRHFAVRDRPRLRGAAVDQIMAQAARLLFEGIMAAPDLPAERGAPRDI